MNNSDIAHAIKMNVTAALAEDLGSGDLTAQLIPADQLTRATLITREQAILCGKPWFDACFQALNPLVNIIWRANEGDRVQANATLCEIHGNTRALLSAERSALNFLQTLSAVATTTRLYVDAVAGTHAQIMDTRKTLPGLRIAQKYAVKMGGGMNQRIGLFDGILIKENHIAAAGGVQAALDAAQRQADTGVSIQIEVESIDELQQALDAGAKLILLDNFSIEHMLEAVRLTNHRANLEASGAITLDIGRAIADTGVARISIGGLFKNVRAVDLCLRIHG